MPPRSNAAPPTTVLYIKHMVCARGIRVVRQELEGLGLQVLDVRLGAATVGGAAGEVDWPRVRATLAAAGFALLETLDQTLAQRVRGAVNRRLRQPGEVLRHRAFGAAVARELGLSYPQLSAAFARLGTGDTLTGFILGQRLAYAQELLAASDLGVGAIARQLGYGSLAHFSAQFRRWGRCSPSAYRRLLRAELAPATVENTSNDARKGV